MKQYSKKAAGLILLLVITCLVFAFLVTGKFYISAFVVMGVILIEVYYLFRLMGKATVCSGNLSGLSVIPISCLPESRRQTDRRPCHKS